MRKLASIQKVWKLSSIEGADRIELAHILGWQCVVNKGKFKEGDLCVYFEIDSFLPVRPEFEFLRPSSYKSSPILGEGFRLRTMKFCGEISQGLAMSLEEVGILFKDNGDNRQDIRDYVFRNPDGTEIEMIENVKNAAFYQAIALEGMDVSNLLGVIEWEIPERAASDGTIIGEAKKYIPVTEETRIQSAAGLLESFSGLKYYITTKLDGTSNSVCVDSEGVFRVFGHNYEYKDDGNSRFYSWVKEHKIEDLVRGYMKKKHLTAMTVQGEFCGEGIQKNRLKLSSPNWYFFTVVEDGNRAGLEEMTRFADFCRDQGADLEMVPVEETGEDLPAEYRTEEALLERAAEDRTGIYKGGQPEGIVIRPVVPVYSGIVGGDLSMKVVNNKYLLKNG